MALDSGATASADNDFYAKHPDMVDADGNHIAIDPNDPAQAGYAAEWEESYDAYKAQNQAASTDEAAPQAEDSQQNVGSPVQDCPLKKCNLAKMVVWCDHPGRSFKLQLPGAESPKHLQHADDAWPEIDVATVDKNASNGLDTVHAKATPIKPLCSVHGNCIAVTGPLNSAGKNYKKRSDGTSLEFKPWSPVRPSSPWGWLGWLWIPNIPHNTFTVSPVACNVADEVTAVTVHAYPQIEWSAGISVNVSGGPGYSKQAGTEGPTANPNAALPWQVVPKLSLKYGGQEIEVSSEFEDAFKKSVKGLQTTMECVNYVAGKLKGLDAVTLKPDWPKISLTYKAALEESKTEYFVDAAYSLEVVFDPLLGVTATVDVIAGLINLIKLGGPAGIATAEFLTKAREWAAAEGTARSVKGEAKVELTADAKIPGNLKFTKEHGKPVAVEGGVKGEIEFQLAAEATIEGHVFKAVFKTGMSASLTFAIGAALKAASDESGLSGAGYFFLSALVWKRGVYASDGSDRQVDPSGGQGGKMEDTTTYEIWGEQRFPKEGSASSKIYFIQRKPVDEVGTTSAGSEAPDAGTPVSGGESPDGGVPGAPPPDAGTPVSGGDTPDGGI